MRVISFLNDTADQSEWLKELGGDRAALSKEGLISFKLQALITNQIVFADSFLYNNFFLHELKNDEYQQFIEFIASTRVLDVRARENPVRGIFAKAWPIRAYWDPMLEKAINEAGAELGKAIMENPGLMAADTVEEYIKAIEPLMRGKLKPGSIADIDYGKFKNLLPRVDKLIYTLREKSLVTPWSSQNVRENPNSVAGVFARAEKKKDLIACAEKAFGKDAAELVEFIKDDNYNGGRAQNICNNIAKLTGNDNANNFFYQELHQGIFCVGVAKQHEAGSFEIQKSQHLSRIKQAIYISKNELNQLSLIPWDEFAKHWADPKFINLKSQLANEMEGEGNLSILNSRFKAILNILGINAEDDITKVTTTGEISTKTTDVVAVKYDFSQLDDGGLAASLSI